MNLVAIGAFLRRYWPHLAIAAMAIALAFTLLRLEVRTAERDKWQTQAAAEKQAHEQTVANYRAASAEAQRQAQANVERVRAEQAQITERTVNDYQARLADVDARYERVRVQLAARTDLSSTDTAPMSIASDATCRAYGGGSCDELLAKLRIAERQAWNLIALRKWAADQALVKVEPVPAD
ncbi:MAG TPA: hypothetical protein VJM09_14180 [Sphingobium sp.]|nr:hypothetical protein [Sphingobium sp.]